MSSDDLPQISPWSPSIPHSAPFSHPEGFVSGTAPTTSKAFTFSDVNTLRRDGVRKPTTDGRGDLAWVEEEDNEKMTEGDVEMLVEQEHDILVDEITNGRCSFVLSFANASLFQNASTDYGLLQPTQCLHRLQPLPSLTLP